MRVFFYGQIRQVCEHQAEFPNVDSIEQLIVLLSKKYGEEFARRFHNRNGLFNGNITVLIDGRNISHVDNIAHALKNAKDIVIFEVVGGG